MNKLIHVYLSCLLSCSSPLPLSKQSRCRVICSACTCVREKGLKNCITILSHCVWHSSRSHPLTSLSAIAQSTLPFFLTSPFPPPRIHLCLLFRAGCASYFGGRRTPALRTALCGRTCAPSGGSWRCRRPTEILRTRRSPDTIIARGCTPSSTCHRTHR